MSEVVVFRRLLGPTLSRLDALFTILFSSAFSIHLVFCVGLTRQLSLTALSGLGLPLQTLAKLQTNIQL